jgi:hypothetical protein
VTSLSAVTSMTGSMFVNKSTPVASTTAEKHVRNLYLLSKNSRC